VLGRLPRAKHGNLVDWVGAIRKTNPRYSIYGDKSFRNFRKVVVLESEWGPLVPPAYFPHAVHVRLLDCSNCHPGIFNIEKKTTKHFRMDYILQGQFCGACHLNVAFPMNDCARCHPKIES
jgi:c(7)-type cytochrome triheme protein